MSKFDDFLNEVKTELSAFAQKSWNDYRDGATADGKAFVEKSKADLERWTKLLGTGDLTKVDFEWLVVGEKDLAELTALKQAGLGQVALDRFVNGLTDLIINAAFKVFLP